jgi:two-component system OmpR family response regulator
VQAAPVQPATARPTERILVVEDEDDVRMVLSRVLDAAGYRVDTASDGAAAIARVKAERPDAVLLDVMLPGRSGFEVCQELKFHRETNLIPILMMTARSDVESRRKGLWVGANAYLTKPFESADLLAALRHTLDHRRELGEHQVHTRVELCMESDGRLREQLNDLLSELFLFTPLSDADVHRIRYAVMEMTDNAIEWGNRRRKELTVRVAYEVTDRFVKFVITDEGPGFNPQRLPHAAADNDPVAHLSIREQLGLRDGGFGIMISRGMVDEVHYNQTGNQVTLVKRFGPPDSNGAGDRGAERPPP